VRDLTIARPVTIKGRPGTILEVTHGSILIDFEHGLPADGSLEHFKEVVVICECHIAFADRANLVLIKEEMEKEDHNQRSTG
jgi:hypothetical protein